MFAAFQKASKSSKDIQHTAGWNWVPISVSRGIADSNIESTAKDLQSEASKMIENQGQWVDIPLSSDDDDRFSPRGILQFRELSEGEFGETSMATDDRKLQSSTINSVSMIQSQTAPKPLIPMTTAKDCNQVAAATTEYNFNESMPITDKTGKDSGDAPTNSGLFYLNLMQDYGAQKVSALSRKVNGNKASLHEVSGMDLNSMDPSLMESPQKMTDHSKSMLGHTSQDTGTQTPSPRDDFSSSKIALQRQLADAMSALDLTRNQANALRDRLHTYTSSMRQQANDLRASSNSLSHALDKAKEYRTYWKQAEKIKDEANQRAEEIGSKAKSLQRAVGEHNSDMMDFNRAIDKLNMLLGVENTSETAQEKLALASREVKILLNLVGNVQVEATIASNLSSVELKEGLRKFGLENRATYVAHAKNNEEVLAGRIRVLEMKNEGLKTQIDTLQQSSNEIKELWGHARRENENKEELLKNNTAALRDIESTLVRTQDELKASVCHLESKTKQNVELRLAFRDENTKLTEEKKQIEAYLAKLRMDLEAKRMNQKDQAVYCDLATDRISSESDSYASVELDSLRSSTYASESQLRRSDAERKALQKEATELKRVVAGLKADIFEKEQDYIRLRGDVRQLHWTSHHQQVTIQRVRAENRSLKISISKLCREREAQEGRGHSDRSQYHQQSESRTGGLLNERNDSDSSSDSERKRLQTIPESSDEGPMSSPGMSPANSEASFPHSQISKLVSSPVQSFLTRTTPVKGSSSEGDDYEPRQNAKFSREESLFTSRTSSARNLLSGSNSDTQYTSRKRRSRKSKRPENTHLPVWRQENPENQYSVASKGRKTRLGSDSSTSSEEAFVSSNASLSAGRSSVPDEQDIAESLISADQPSRLVGIPMDEEEFEKLIGSVDHNDLTPILRSIPRRTMPFRMGEASFYDDGYSSSVADPSEANKGIVISEPLHSTRLFPNFSRSSSDAPRASRLVNVHREQCFLTYNGVTFDATTFDITKMRQIAWEAGINESENGMNEFIDFLADKAKKLEEDPEWRGKHSLGKSSDWLSLKGLLC